MTDINQGQVQRQSSQNKGINHPVARHPEQITHKMMHQQQQQQQHIQRIPPQMTQVAYYANHTYNRNHFINKNSNRATSSAHRPVNWICWPQSYNINPRNNMKYDRAFKIATQFEADFNPIKTSHLTYFCKKYQSCLEAHNRNPLNRMAPLIKKSKEPDCRNTAWDYLLLEMQWVAAD